MFEVAQELRAEECQWRRLYLDRRRARVDAALDSVARAAQERRFEVEIETEHKRAG